MTRAEILVDAFARMYNCLDPQGKSYRLRNPMLLRAFNPKHVKDEEGYRIFNNFSSGWDNGLLDVLIKCKGGSRTGLTPDNTLMDLVLCYGNPRTACKYIINFLHHITWMEGMADVRETTRLGWFIEDAKIPEKNAAAK